MRSARTLKSIRLPVKSLGSASGERISAYLELLVAPLVAVRVEERRGVLLPGRAVPVEREGERGPAGLRPQLLLAHVVRPAATRLADAAAQHQHVDDAAVVHVAVVPVIHRGADDDHGLAVGLVGVVGKLACDGDHVLRLHAGDGFLPLRRVGDVVVVGCRGVAAETAPDSVVRAEQVEHGRDQRLAAGELQLSSPARCAPARRRPGRCAGSARGRCRRSTGRPPGPRRRARRAASGAA